jgi:hypothetical protein
MAEELTEKLIEKVREYVFLYDTGHPGYKNLVKNGEACTDTRISEELNQTSKFVLFTYLYLYVLVYYLLHCYIVIYKV